ncbi:SbtR family transcriptional regulator [Saccharopolyspora sp. 5N708]|uniref:SbtR family transcriptional regulator n=1 Tax=Saccharopolyspora sp. 5N708 TaxID=3457424 RepID=UPI003FD5C356
MEVGDVSDVHDFEADPGHTGHPPLQQALDETYAPVIAAVTKLLDACVAEGSVRDGLDPADVLLLMGFLWRVSPGEDGVRQGRRLVQIVFDGIRRNHR